MRVDLIRLENSEQGSFGVLKVKGKVFCVTLEPPDKGNKKYVSCIPPGVYLCRRITSPKFGTTFIIKDVPTRSNVLFHAGNVLSHTSGCVLIGQYFGKLRKNRAVLNSGSTFIEFMKKMEGINSFALNVCDYS